MTGRFRSMRKACRRSVPYLISVVVWVSNISLSLGQGFLVNIFSDGSNALACPGLTSVDSICIYIFFFFVFQPSVASHLSHPLRMLYTGSKQELHGFDFCGTHNARFPFLQHLLATSQACYEKQRKLLVALVPVAWPPKHIPRGDCKLTRRCLVYFQTQQSESPSHAPNRQNERV